MNNNLRPISSSRAWMLDVDGCLMRTSQAGGVGGEAMPRASELVRDLYAAGHAVVVCTNASEQPPENYAAHLRKVGIPVRDDDFITAGSAAAQYVAHHHPGKRVLVLGSTGISNPLEKLGITPHDPADGPADVVVVGAGASYTKEAINCACLAVDAGAPLYATVDVPWFHGGRGKSVCISAAIAHAITWVTGVKPQVLGKPSVGLAETLLRHLGASPGEITIVGDATAEIDTARLMGANSALVLSGATDEALLSTLSGDKRPDGVFADVAELHELISPELSTY